MDKIVYIMRGIPGSGKSTLARTLVSNPNQICSADDFFTKDGEYKFVSSLLPDAHEWVFDKFKTLVGSGVDRIAVDNCNIHNIHVSKYRNYAEYNGYVVVLVEFLLPKDPLVLKQYVDKCVQRNQHSVPEETIQRYARQLKGA